MTREEAIEYLVGMDIESLADGLNEAVTMAIEALKDRPKGEWVAHATAVGGKEYIEYSRCSECGEMALVRMNYCPNCGADMRGEEE